MFNHNPKPLYWLGDSLNCIRLFPETVKDVIGHGLHLAQIGEKHPHAKPLKGFTGAGTLEIISNNDGDTYRAVYTVNFSGVVYVLHTFQKKSTKGIATPKPHIDLIKKRLKQAEDHYSQHHNP